MEPGKKPRIPNEKWLVKILLGLLANNAHKNLLAKETNEPAYCLRFAFPSAIYCRMHYLLRGGHHREVVVTAI